MNNVRTPLAFLLATTLALAGAHAQEPVTRAQVVADYAAAVRIGDVLAAGDSGMKLNELYPNRYAAKASTAKTREQVVSELRVAIRGGDVLAAGDTGLKENELHPERFPSTTPVAGRTREQVRAETLEAIRTGDMLAGGDSGLKLNELFPQRYAAALEAHRAFAAANAGLASTRLQ